MEQDEVPGLGLPQSNPQRCMSAMKSNAALALLLSAAVRGDKPSNLLPPPTSERGGRSLRAR